MPNVRKIGVVVIGMAVLATALPAQPKFTKNQLDMYTFAKRQNAATTAAGLNDVDILQL